MTNPILWMWKVTIKRFHLRIAEGMTSKEISEELIDAGIIDDANGFNTFLAERKLQHLIQIGEYDVDSEMSFSTNNRNHYK